MSEKTQALMKETLERYNDFQVSLKDAVSSIEKDMENIEQMSQHAELYEKLASEVERLRVRVENAVRKPEEIARPFDEFQETVSLLRMIEINVSKLVLSQASQTLSKTEEAIEMARKITGSD